MMVTRPRPLRSTHLSRRLLVTIAGAVVLTACSSADEPVDDYTPPSVETDPATDDDVHTGTEAGEGEAPQAAPAGDADDPAVLSELARLEALGLEIAVRPDSVHPTGWWSEVLVGQLFLVGDGEIPDDRDVISAWASPANSDLPLDQARKGSEQVAALAKAALTGDGLEHFPEVYADSPQAYGMDAVRWDGWQLGGATMVSAPSDGERFRVGAAIWEADRDPSGQPFGGWRLSVWPYQLNEAGEWIPVSCASAPEDICLLNRELGSL